MQPVRSKRSLEAFEWLEEGSVTPVSPTGKGLKRAELSQKEKFSPSGKTKPAVQRATCDYDFR